MDEVLRREPRLTAIVAGSQSIATGVFERLRALGRVIPRDISVVSMGSARLAQLFLPRLTTVDVRLADCGRAAVRYIMARSRGETELPVPAFQARLIVGDSDGPVAVAEGNGVWASSADAGRSMEVGGAVDGSQARG